MQKVMISCKKIKWEILKCQIGAIKDDRDRIKSKRSTNCIIYYSGNYKIPMAIRRKGMEQNPHMKTRQYSVTMINQFGDQCSQEVEIKVHNNDTKTDIERKVLNAISVYLEYSMQWRQLVMAVYITIIVAGLGILYFLYKIYEINASIKEDHRNIKRLKDLTSEASRSAEWKADTRSGYVATIIIIVTLSTWLVALLAKIT